MKNISTYWQNSYFMQMMTRQSALFFLKMMPNLNCEIISTSFFSKNKRQRKSPVQQMLTAIAVFLWFVFYATAFSQSESNFVNESGIPDIQNFSPKDYRASSQNWAIVQDLRGIMYFGNVDGVLEYDGVHWRLIRTPQNATIRSLAMDKTGRIFAGSIGDLGYLAPDSTGTTQFVSLKAKLPINYRDFTDVWYTRITPDGVYFMTYHFLARWNGTEMTVWDPPVSNFYRCITISDTLMVYCGVDVGLAKMVDDSLQIIPNSTGFRYVNFVAQTSDGAILGASINKLVRYNGSTFEIQNSAVDAYLAKHELYSGCAIPGTNLYALGTLSGGVVITDADGNIKNILNKNSSLRDETIWSLNNDNQGGLWIGMNNGLARVALPPQSTFYDESLGIEGTVEAMIRHKGILYTATSNGVYFLEPGVSVQSQPRFREVENIGAQCWDLFSTGDDLFSASHNGVHQISGNRGKLIYQKNTNSLYQSRFNPNFIFVGTEFGLAFLKKTAGKWAFAGMLPGIKDMVNTIAEDNDGNIWAVNSQVNVRKFTLKKGVPFDKLTDADVTITNYEKTPPLKNKLPASTYFFDGKLLVSTNKGVLFWDEDRFRPATFFGNLADTTLGIMQIKRSPGDVDRVAAIQNGETKIGVIDPENRQITVWDNPRFAELRDHGQIYTMFPDNGFGGESTANYRYLWLSNDEGLRRYDLTITPNVQPDFPMLIRRVTVNSDSLIFGGTDISEPRTVHELPYKNNALRIEFSGLSYAAPEANRYQYFLEGFDNDWSHWTVESQKDYTNLPEGNYRFRVRSQNLQQQISEEAAFAFAILPPWYRTGLAYFIYTILGILGLFSLVRWRVSLVEKRAEALEAIVAERTAQLAEQSEKLKELDKLKSRFFTNISHEFRTPLTLILGPMEKLAEDVQSDKSRTILQVMRRNANRLLKLINQLLDLSRLDAGKLSLHLQNVDLLPLMNGIAMSYESLAEMRNITLTVDFPEQPLQTAIDVEKFENICHNLLSNAFKFTPNDGKIDIALDLQTGANLNEPYFEIRVCDTGEGISADRLENIFNRFYQVDDSPNRAHEGTGIGLALTKELVELHNGSISVTSKPGEGSAFTVRFPFGQIERDAIEIMPTPTEIFPKTNVSDEFFGNNSTTSAEMTAPENGSQNTAKPLLLLIEDNPDMRLYIRTYLDPEFSVIEAVDGETGVTLAQETIPDLVISDLMMPKMDGFTVCKHLKTDERTSHIPVILLTARAAREDKLTGLETGADDYLIKPFDAKELVVRVKNLIELRSQLRERFSNATVIKPTEVAATSIDELFLEKIISVIDAHIGEEHFFVEQLAETIGMSVSQLNRKLGALIDQPAGQLIRSMRLQRAADLLKQNAGNVAEICYEVGFSNQANFTRAFKKQFGVSPMAYRRKYV